VSKKEKMFITGILFLLGILLLNLYILFLVKSKAAVEVPAAPQFNPIEWVSSINAPINQSLNDLASKILSLEKNRSAVDATLTQQMVDLKSSSNSLSQVTMNLSRALTNSQSQGALGEIHLKNLLEGVGLKEGTDFELQQRTSDENIPDCIINLPNDKAIIIDCKSPTKAALEYFEATTEAKKLEKLKKLNTAIKNHIRSLSDKEYFKDLPNAFEYVILYLPSDSLLLLALQADPDLPIYANAKKIALSSPSTIIPIIRNIQVSWQQENLNKNLQEAVTLTNEIISSWGDFLVSFQTIGKEFTKATNSYNSALDTLNNHKELIVKLQKLSKN